MLHDLKTRKKSDMKNQAKETNISEKRDRWVLNVGERNILLRYPARQYFISFSLKRMKVVPHSTCRPVFDKVRRRVS